MFHVVLVFAFLKLDVMEQLCQYYKQLMIYQLKQLISYTTKNCINHKTQVGSISFQKFQSGLHNKLLGHVKLHLLVYILLGERLFLAPMQLMQSQIGRASCREREELREHREV